MVNRKARWAAALALVFGCLSGAGGAAGPPQRIRISGCGTDLGTFRLLGEAYRKVSPDAAVEVLPSLGSGGGIKAVLAGALDVGLSARPLTAEEAAGGATATPYARTPLVLAVGERTRATAISRNEVVGYYSGSARTWPDGTPVRLVMRPATDADTTILMSLSREVSAAVSGALSRDGMVIAATDQEAADALERSPGALGSTTLALIRAERRALRPLALDGVEPTPAALAGGRYPLFKTLYVVVGPRPSAAVREFLGYLRTPAARRVLEDTGHVTLERGKP